MRNLLARALCTTTALTIASGAMAVAPGKNGSGEFWNMTVGIESGDDYGAQNPISSAHGRYQIIVGNYEDQGLVRQTKPIPKGTKGEDRWKYYEFTAEACAQGVCSYRDLDTSAAGRVMQDRVASGLAQNMWNTLNNGASGSYVGRTVNGVTVSEASLLGGAWFLGPGMMNQWAAEGFSVDTLRRHPDLADIIRDNSNISSAEDLQTYMMERMAKYGPLDISEITNGQFTPGGGTYTSEEFLVCDPEINEYLLSSAEQHVKDVVAAAQDEQLGYSQLGEGEEFGEMSCIDSIFTGSLDVLFKVPNLADLGKMAVDAVCSQTNQLVANANAGIGEKMNQLTAGASSSVGGKGFISNYGVQTNWNRSGATGVNVDVAGGDVGQTNPLDVANYGSQGGGGTNFTPTKRPGAYSAMFQ
jgi:hypothetical protein